MVKTYKDELKREFIDLNTVAEIIGLSQRHTKRLIRTNNWLSIKHGKRFILIDDFKRTYPDHLSALLSKIEEPIATKTDIPDIKQPFENKTDVQNVRNVQNLEESDKEIMEFEPITNKEILYQKTVNTIQRLEKTLANIEYIQRDTLRIDGRLEKQTKELKNLTELIKRQGDPKLISWLKEIVLIVILLTTVFLFIRVYSMLNPM